MTRDAPTQEPGQAPAIRLAYIVLAHSDPQLFGRLMHRLSHPEVAAFVHLDKRAPLAPFEDQVRDLPNVHFLENRIHVMWAGFSQVESTLQTFETALAVTDERCTHFVIISGADYPLASNPEILDFFAKRPQQQFIRRFDLMASGDSHQTWRVRGRYFREWADRFTWKRRPLFILERLARLIPRRLPTGVRFATGSNWVALTRDCVAYCVNKARTDHALIDFFRPAFGPDEIFLHTLVENSPFRDQATPIEPYVDISKIGGPFAYGNVHALTPKVPITTAAEAEAILASRGEKLFTRKLASDRSEAALAVFDKAALER
ncbi:MULTISPECIES: beta-1,6-N-acetylglucosaminyltransferase [unclassified Sphingomonas]|uniref:beta-1,6-N-acetylglucosaminyltransferase n=1 Tax=Sphingomonas sp. GC_Shp_1 TaxID=2937385 RepID=UPI00226B5F1B|nr:MULTISPECIES: beta-1,6-N-acetylglucosaminyltransferase [unclassified Sphingomonas]